MNLNVNTGLKEYDINGAIKVCFNPTDTVFAEKVVDTFSSLESKQDVYRREIADASTHTEVFDIARKWDKDMRTMIDGIFDAPVSQAVFGDMNVYAIADGLPVWMNLLFAVMDEISTGFQSIETDVPAKIKNYIDKYKGTR